ncbi:GspE/PulE family protein [Patescibacteria group bacterium]|nr:type II/IV secretion system protein [Candidatus Falkowbacteria bacterium]MBU3906317.1 GspE/PulE family protein [Patescibacteria group bacterium]MCG2698274.1 GspE/PulE family protein [Candidatus Parcubacteria bacterium]MBU4015600.1 GspE/PulE family protein [Patescibacteria group bacterium]MBU4027136.1 GspE/PulE family protein [Patescibacteria group bacterium]
MDNQGKQVELLNLLLQENLVSINNLSEIKSLSEQGGKSIEDIIFEKNLVDPEEYIKVKSRVYGMPYESLLETKISDLALIVIPPEVAKNYKVVCFDKSGGKIKIGIADPDNFKAVEAVNFLAKEEKLQVEYYLISARSFHAAVKQYRTFNKEISSALETRAEEEEQEREKSVKKEAVINRMEVTKSAPVAKIVSVIIRHAVEGRASDIHIEPVKNETRVRYRIDGILRTSLVLPITVHDSIIARIKVLADLKLDETRVPQDGRIRLLIEEREVDFRVSILPLLGREKAVMRILEANKKPPSLVELGFQGRGLRVIKNNIKKTEGLFLVTGPTGSGKSTTLFSIISEINKEGINIATLEDPIEYQVKGVNQSQIRPEIGYSFSSGLRSLLRQDPDVIMVGEIRDDETAELAIHSSLTGHFVLSTLHTNDALGSIVRLLDMGVEPFLLASTLNTVIAQRLARKICPHCKAEEELPKDFLIKIKKEIKKIPIESIEGAIKDFNIDKLVFYKGKGCSRCVNTGYIGRIALAEVMDVNDKMKKMIISGKKTLNVESIQETQKFLTLLHDGIIKVLQGFTSFEEILRVVNV